MDVINKCIVNFPLSKLFKISMSIHNINHEASVEDVRNRVVEAERRVIT